MDSSTFPVVDGVDSSYPDPSEYGDEGFEQHWIPSVSSSSHDDSAYSQATTSASSSYSYHSSAYFSSHDDGYDGSLLRPHSPAAAFPVAAPASVYAEDDVQSTTTGYGSFPSESDSSPRAQSQYAHPLVVPLGPTPVMSVHVQHHQRPSSQQSSPHPRPSVFQDSPRDSTLQYRASAAPSLYGRSVSAAPMLPAAVNVSSTGRIVRPYTTSPYDGVSGISSTASSVQSSPRYAVSPSAEPVVSAPMAVQSTMMPSSTAPFSRSVSQPASPCHAQSLIPPSPSAALAYHRTVMAATTLSHAPRPQIVQAVESRRAIAATVQLKAIPAAVRASSASAPNAVMAATTVRSVPASPAAAITPTQATASRFSSSTAVHALPAMTVNVAAPALTLQSEQLTPSSAGGKKRRREPLAKALGRGSATDSHVASQHKHFTYEASQATRALEPAVAVPSSPHLLSTPFPRRRFSTVSTASSISGASLGSEDSNSSAPPHVTPFLTTEDLARLTAPRSCRSQSICAATTVQATPAREIAAKRRRSHAAVEFTPARGVAAAHVPARPASPSAHPLSESSLTRLVHLSNPLSRLMVVKAVEYLFAAEHDKANELVPSPSQVSTGSETSEASEAGGDPAWQGLGARVRDYLRARFAGEGAALVDECVGHVLFVHERGWAEYSETWEKEPAADPYALADLRMHRVTSDISGNIRALTLSS